MFRIKNSFSLLLSLGCYQDMQTLGKSVGRYTFYPSILAGHLAVKCFLSLKLLTQQWRFRPNLKKSIKIMTDKCRKILLTLQYPIKEHACLLIFNILPPMLALILPSLFIDFWILPLLLVYSVFPKKTHGTAIL